MSQSTATSQSATETHGVAAVAKKARAAARALARLSGERRNEVLIAAASAIEANAARILEANAKDCRAAQPAVDSGAMTNAMFARLQLSEKGVAHIAAQIREVAKLPDPLGIRLAATELDDGLVLIKESCPLGVVGVVFESRPDVGPQVAALALKSGNAAILKGGAEAAHTNEAIVAVWRESLEKFPDVPVDAVSLLQNRADVLELLALDRDVDLIIPRGSYSLVQFIMKNSRIPVLGHGDGICHIYVDRAADMQKALDVALDAKVQAPSVCNAVETLLVHHDIAAKFIPAIAAKLAEAHVEIRGDAHTAGLAAGHKVVAATEADWGAEYCDLIISVRVVASLDEAIEHINHYGSRHTDAIITEDAEAARRFMNEVDAAGVFQNASTRFSDGFRYGFGAEVGISTSKLHARGPMGLEGLTTYKFKLYGQGHAVGPYVKGEKKFTHKRLS